MKITEIEKLNQLVSRNDMTGNEKVEWLTDFIDKYVTEQLRLNDVSNRRELLEAYTKQVKEDNELTEEITFQCILELLTQINRKL